MDYYFQWVFTFLAATPWLVWGGLSWWHARKRARKTNRRR